MTLKKTKVHTKIFYEPLRDSVDTFDIKIYANIVNFCNKILQSFKWNLCFTNRNIIIHDMTESCMDFERVIFY